jgi:hypothetical protein
VASLENWFRSARSANPAQANYIAVRWTLPDRLGDGHYGEIVSVQRWANGEQNSAAVAEL